MSILIGTVRNAESKPSQYGDGMYNRIQLEGDNGHKSWYTSYANTLPEVGDYITVEIGESKKSGKEYIRSWKHKQEGADEYTPKAQTPARSAPAASQGNDSRERQISIVSQAIFKAAYPVLAEDLSVEEVLNRSIKGAMYLEKAIKKAVAAQHMENAKQALEAEQQHQEAQQADDDGGFIDDDVPFSSLRGDLYAL